MYNDQATAITLMQSRIKESLLILNGKSREPKGYSLNILEQAAVEMLERVKRRKENSA